MIKSILKSLSGNSTGDPLKKNAGELQIATCALLLEIAHADDEFLPEEGKRIEALMKAHFSLPEKEFQEILNLSEQKRKNSIDLWHFTRTIKEHYASDQKEKIIEMLWGVIYTDGMLNEHEDYIVHKLATMLDLDHKQLIDAKLRVKRHNS